jgi:hypothetical protein
MSNEELINWCSSELEKAPYLQFPEELFLSLSPEQASLLAKRFGANCLMKLPEREIRFFEWLKNEDSNVWKDLWENADEEPYIVGMAFLPLLLDERRGFPICDLLYNDNFYFKKEFMTDVESQLFLESVQKRFLDHQQLTIGQLLTLEISVGPIDIWHFSYFRNLKIADVKKAVDQLVEDKIIVHLTQADHLAVFIDF